MAAEASFCPANLGARAIVAVDWIVQENAESKVNLRAQVISSKSTRCGTISTQEHDGGVASEA